MWSLTDSEDHNVTIEFLNHYRLGFRASFGFATDYRLQLLDGHPAANPRRKMKWLNDRLLLIHCFSPSHYDLWVRQPHVSRFYASKHPIILLGISGQWIMVKGYKTLHFFKPPNICLNIFLYALSLSVDLCLICLPCACDPTEDVRIHFNLLTPTGHVLHQQFNVQQLYALPHTVFICFVFIWEQTATCATCSINWLVFVTEMKSVYCAVRTGSLNKTVCASSLKV